MTAFLVGLSDIGIQSVIRNDCLMDHSAVLTLLFMRDFIILHATRNL